jgi:2-dehydro-3-deoxygalactonokinase
MNWTIAVDWGTSSFRAFLVDPRGAIVDRIATAHGILAVPNNDFAAVLEAAVLRWRDQHLDAVILASGMIGSRNGWREAPYVPCPADPTALAAGMVAVETPRLGRVWLVPGVMRRDARGVPDVMRGEETQILGALEPADRGPRFFVLPGTHSKWALWRDGAIAWFATFMTGEIYAALREHTILGRLMQGDRNDPLAFRRGLRAGGEDAGLLHRLFSARTLALFDEIAPTGLASYLSGMLIGHEIAAARRMLAEFGVGGIDSVAVIGGERQGALYEAALSEGGRWVQRGGDEVTVRGLVRLAASLGRRSG